VFVKVLYKALIYGFFLRKAEERKKCKDMIDHNLSLKKKKLNTAHGVSQGDFRLAITEAISELVLPTHD